MLRLLLRLMLRRLLRLLLLLLLLVLMLMRVRMDRRYVEVLVTEAGRMKRLISHGVPVVVIGRRMMVLRNVQRKVETLVPQRDRSVVI